jgi:hypothetical protein
LEPCPHQRGGRLLVGQRIAPSQPATSNDP